MTKPEVLRLLEETLALKPQSLTGAERLADLDGWDSLSTMAFIAMADKEYGLPLPGQRVVACQTVDELVGLLEVSVSGRAA
jgi:acyl carrier protein